MQMERNMPTDHRTTRPLPNVDWAEQSIALKTRELRETTKRHARSTISPAVKLAVVGMVAAISPFGSRAAQAVILTWDNAATATNNWSTAATNANWDSDGNGSGDTVWINGSSAVFGATPESVSPTVAVIVDDITFNDSWTIANGGAASINLTTDGNSDITVGTGFNSTIAEVLSGTNTVTKLGTGTLTLTNGNTLRDMGLPPGPRYSIILKRLRDAWLDGEVTNPAEEKNLLQALLKGD